MPSTLQKVATHHADQAIEAAVKKAIRAGMNQTYVISAVKSDFKEYADVRRREFIAKHSNPYLDELDTGRPDVIR